MKAAIVVPLCMIVGFMPIWFPIFVGWLRDREQAAPRPAGVKNEHEKR